MAVTVLMRIKVPDWERFRRAYEELFERPAAPGFIEAQLLRRDGDPDEVLLLQRWESHAAMGAFTDEIGEEFNRAAGTEGAEWDDSVWEASGVTTVRGPGGDRG
ncbi:MAG TPA: antibiotic biosynthesis monooxygenase [Candidatus Acidoferrales bacterium]|nr:antibiotic biosynthesis monooxygenase [Candidatus Acidoferrales bacterium]